MGGLPESGVSMFVKSRDIKIRDGPDRYRRQILSLRKRIGDQRDRKSECSVGYPISRSK